MNDKHLNTLEKIVALDGNCLTDQMCRACPFAKKCLPEFVVGRPLSRKQRLEAALDKLAKLSLMDDDNEEIYL